MFFSANFPRFDFISLISVRQTQQFKHGNVKLEDRLTIQQKAGLFR